MNANIEQENDEDDLTPTTPVPREDAKKQNEAEFNLGDDDIAEDEEDSVEEYSNDEVDNEL